MNKRENENDCDKEECSARNSEYWHRGLESMRIDEEVREILQDCQIRKHFVEVDSSALRQGFHDIGTKKVQHSSKAKYRVGQ